MASPLQLLTADAADLALSGLLAPQWGVFLDGLPVIQPATLLGQAVSNALSGVQQVASLIGLPNILPVTASTVEFDYSQDWPISNYPQEQGAFQSYDKVTMPFDVKLRLAAGGSNAVRAAFLQTCLAMANSLNLYDVVTPELTFSSCNVTHVDWRRSATNGVTLIQVDMWFQEIPVGASASFEDTQQPGEAAPQGLGNIQPTAPGGAILSSFASGIFALQ